MSPTSDGPFERLRRSLPLIAFVLCLMDGKYLLDMIARTPDNDFSKAYWSTVVFRRGGDLYGINPSTPSGFTAEGARHFWNLNPPHFHFLMLPFTALPIYPALALWCLLSAICFSAALYAIRRELCLSQEQWHLALVGTLAFIGTTASLWCGHCSFLLMLLVTWTWLAARHGRWTRAGLYLGLGMSIKPFLLMLLPYLLLRRRWRAATAAAAMSLLCFAAGAAVFGIDAHLAWREKLAASSGWCWQFLSGSLYGLLARTLTVNPMGECLLDCPPGLVTLLWLGLGVPIGLATLAASSAETTADVDRSFALLLTAALLLSPLGWTYYFLLPLGPMTAVVLDWQRSADTVSPWSRRLLLTAACGLVCPLSLCRLFQPSVAATLLLGNLFSYCVLAVWAALLIDGLRALRARRQAA